MTWGPSPRDSTPLRLSLVVPFSKPLHSSKLHALPLKMERMHEIIAHIFPAARVYDSRMRVTFSAPHRPHHRSPCLFLNYFLSCPIRIISSLCPHSSVYKALAFEWVCACVRSVSPPPGRTRTAVLGVQRPRNRYLLR